MSFSSSFFIFHFSFFFFSFFIFFSHFFIANLLWSSSTQFVVVLFFRAFYTAPFSSKHFCFVFVLFVFCFVRSLSTQLFFLVVFLLLLLRKTAFSFFSSTCDFFTLFFLSHLPPSSFLEWLSSEQFAELGSVQLLAFSARACSLAFLSLGVPFLAIWYI